MPHRHLPQTAPWILHLNSCLLLYPCPCCYIMSLMMKMIYRHHLLHLRYLNLASHHQSEPHARSKCAQCAFSGSFVLEIYEDWAIFALESAYRSGRTDNLLRELHSYVCEAEIFSKRHCFPCIFHNLIFVHECEPHVYAADLDWGKSGDIPRIQGMDTLTDCVRSYQHGPRLSGE